VDEDELYLPFELIVVAFQEIGGNPATRGI